MTQNTPFTKAKLLDQYTIAKKIYYINSTLKQELHLIERGLSDNSIPKACPIAHLIPCTPLGIAPSDSSLDVAGGCSFDCSFWWYFEWQALIRARTLKHVKNNSNCTLFDINVLEYEAITVTFLSTYHAITRHPPDHCADPHPVVLIHRIIHLRRMGSERLPCFVCRQCPKPPF